MNQMVQMMKQMQEMQAKLNSTTGCNNNNTNRNNRRQRNKTKYCWSHGACAHNSASCQSKKEGHQDNATFNNKMGGSTNYCE